MDELFNDFYEVTEQCLAPIIKDQSSRGRSWDRCYRFFQKYHGSNQKQRETPKEMVCLHLGFYLASWGMFRGSGSLMHKDYTIYEQVVNLIFQHEYEALWKPEFFRDLLTSNNRIRHDSQEISLIFKLKKQIEDYINSLTVIKNRLEDVENAHATDTIISKILMGTIGCTPAYDTYFRKGLSACKICRCGSLTGTSFAKLLNICRENRIWSKLQKRPVEYYGVVYPVMRMVDLYFWTKGFNASRND
jgi:hypothetical protein